MKPQRFLLVVLLFGAIGVSFAATAFVADDEGQLPPTYVPSGKTVVQTVLRSLSWT
jgi:hypothetical protein